MGAKDTTRTAGHAGGSTLLAAGDEPWRACRSYLVDVESTADALLGVVVDREWDEFLAGWSDWIGSARDLAVLGVGSESRGPAATAPESSSRAAVRAVGAAELDDLPVMVRTYVEEWAEADRRAVVYVEGVAGLVPAVGLHGLVGVVDDLLEQARATGTAVYVAAPTARADAARIVTPLFDDVLDVDRTAAGSYRATRRETPALAPDRLFDLLRPDRRRRLLQYLSRVDAASVEELASYLRSTDRRGEPAGSDDERRVGVALYQFDLPKLDDAGVVAFEPDPGTVEVRDRIDALRPYLALAAHHDAQS